MDPSGAYFSKTAFDVGLEMPPMEIEVVTTTSQDKPNATNPQKQFKVCFFLFFCNQCVKYYVLCVFFCIVFVIAGSV